MRLGQAGGDPSPPKVSAGHDGHERETGNERGDREIRARPGHTRSFGAPEDAEARQEDADDELDRVLGNALERSPDERSAEDHEDHRRQRRSRGEAEPSLRAPEGHDDERHLEPLEQNALERDGERVPVRSRAA